MMALRTQVRGAASGGWWGSWFPSYNGSASNELYRITLSNFEEATIQSGKLFKEWSGNVTVTLAGQEPIVLADTNVTANTPGILFADFIVPEISTTSDVSIEEENDRAIITVKAIDKYIRTSTGIASGKVKLLIGDKEVNNTTIFNPSEHDWEELTGTRNGTSTVIGFQQQFEIHNLLIALEDGMILRIEKEAVVDDSGNTNEQIDIPILNCLATTQNETHATSAFLGNSNIQRQEIQSVKFVQSLSGVPAIDNIKCWDASSAKDETIIAYYTESTAPYNVIIASDNTIYANPNSNYLFNFIGSSTSATTSSVLQGLDKLNTSFLRTTQGMFKDCGTEKMTSLALPNSFTTTRVTDMSYMFQNCGRKAMTSLTFGTGFTTANVTDMSYMFSGTGYTAMTSLSLSNFNTTEVVNMAGMFQNCGYTAMTTLTLGSNFNTAKVTDMSYMFQNCGYNKLASINFGSNFDTAKVTNMSYMFNGFGYKELTRLYFADKFDTALVTNMTSMFENCGRTKLAIVEMGPKFTKIASAHTNFATNFGISTAATTVYCMESIYKDHYTFELSEGSATTIAYATGTINPSANGKAPGPTVSVTPSSATVCKTTNVTVTFTKNIDNLSSTSGKYYLSSSSTSLSDGTWTSFTSGTAFTIGTGKTGTYYLFVQTTTDTQGRISNTNGTMTTIGSTVYHRFGSYIFDNANPTITLDKTSATVCKTTNVKITVADTGPAGLNSTPRNYFLSTSSAPSSAGTISTYTSGSAVTIGSGLTGTYYLFVEQVTDTVGNASTTSGTVVTVGSTKYHRFGTYIFDNANPTITVNPASATVCKTKSVTITLADTGAAGLATTPRNYFLATSTTPSSAGTTSTYTSGTAFTIGSGLTGTYYLFVEQVKDTVGNASTANGTVVTVGTTKYHRFGSYIFDNTNPTITLDKTSATVCKTTSVKITAADSGPATINSTPRNYFLSTSTTPSSAGTTSTYTSGTAVTIGTGLTGTYYLFVEQVTDSVGNASTTAGTVVTVGSTKYHRFGTYIFDNTNPTITVSPTSAEVCKTANVTITAADSGPATLNSTPRSYFLSTSTSPTSAGTVSTYTSGTAVTIGTGLTGTYYLFVQQVADSVGNVSTTAGTLVTIGSTKYHRFGTYIFDNTPPQISPDVVKDGLIRNYDADNNTGTGHSNTATSWKDLTGTANGTVTGATFSSENQPNDEYLSLDGTDDWVNLGQISVTNAVTLEATVELKAVQSGEVIIMANYESGGMGLALVNGVPVFQIHNGSGYANASHSAALTVGQKYHILGTYDGANIKIYLDGVLKATVAKTGNIQAPASSTVMAIGTNPSGSASGGGFANIKLYSARIYNRALSQAEINQNKSQNTNKTWAQSHNVTGMISDMHSGLATGASLQYAWSTSNTTAPSFSTAATISSYSAGAANATFSGSGNGYTGKYFLWVKPVTLKDKVGNSQTNNAVSAGRVYFDNTAPTVGTMKMGFSSGANDYTNNTWTNKNVYIAIDSQGSDSHSGRKSTTYAVTKNGSAYLSNQTGANTLSEEGTYSITVTTTDNAGNTATSSAYTVKIDKTAPTISVTHTSGGATYSGGWTNQDVVSTITFSDGASGITASTLQWKDTNTDWTSLSNTSTSTYTHTWSDERNAAAQYRIRDEAGNYGYTAEFNIKIDKTKPGKPTYTAFHPDDNASYTSGTWTNYLVHTTIKATDAAAGIKQIEYSTDKSTWTKFNFSAGALTQSGNQWSGTEPWGLRNRNDSYYFRSIDNAGNISDVSSTYDWNIRYDITKMTVSISPNTAGSATNAVQSATVTVTMDDTAASPYSGLAGNAQFNYGWSTSTSTAPSYTSLAVTTYSAGAANATFTLNTPTTTGMYYLWLVPTNVKDVAGNAYTTTIKSEAFYIDYTAPTITLSPNTAGSATSAVKSSTVTVTVADNGTTPYSGLKAGQKVKYGWSADTSTAPTYTSYTLTNTAGTASTTFTVDTPTTTGTYYLWVVPDTSVSDVAGNTTNATVKSSAFYIDRTAPTISLNPTTAGSSTNAVYSSTVTVTVADNGTSPYSGLKAGQKVKYGWSANTSTAPSYTSYTLTNAAGAASTTFTVDTPTTTGTYYLWVVPDTTVSDVAGNTTNATVKSEAFYIDRTAPTVTLDKTTAGSSTNAVKTSTVTVTLADNGTSPYSGLASGAKIEYGWSTSTSTAPTYTEASLSYTAGAATTTFTVNTPTTTGTYYLWVKPTTLKDRAGNTTSASSIQKTGAFYIDYTAPTVALNPTTAGSSTSAVYSSTVTVTVADNGTTPYSGLASGAKIEYGWSTSTSTAPTYTEATLSYSAGAASTTFIVNTPTTTGTYYLWVKPTTLKDRAGNTTSASAIEKSGAFYIDRTAPTISLNPNTAGSSTNAVYSSTVTVTVADNGTSPYSGLKAGQKVKYGWSTSTSTAPTYTPYTLTNTAGEASTTFTVDTPTTTGTYYLWVVPDTTVSDVAGNTTNTTVKSEAFYIDRTAPTVTLDKTTVGAADNAVYSSTVKVTLADNGTNPYSGLASGAKIEYGWSANTSTAPTYTEAALSYTAGAETTTFTINTPTTTGTYYLWVKPTTLKDRAGNQTSTTVIKTGAFYIDRTAPTISLNPTTAGSSTNAVKTSTVTVTLADNGTNPYSGLASGAKIEYGWSTSTSTAPTYTEATLSYTAGAASTTFTVNTPTTTNIWYLWVKPTTLKDRAGNTTSASSITKSDAFYIDYTAPTITLSPNTIGSSTNAVQSQTVTVTVADNGTTPYSGLKDGQKVKYGWSTSTSTEPSYTQKTLTNTAGEATTTFTVNTPNTTGTYYLWVVPDTSVSDRAGNATTATVKSAAFYIDLTAPEIIINPNTNTTWAQSQSTTVTLKDNGTTPYSGLATGASMQYKWTTDGTNAPTSGFSNASISSYSAGATTATFPASINGVTGHYYLWVKPVTLSDRAGNSNTTPVHSQAFYVDNTKPIWQTQNINIDKANKKVTVELIGSDAHSGYASNSLDTGDITVYVDGESASSVKKELSTATVGTTVKYTLTLSDFEQTKMLQSGKGYAEWSGALSINIAAGTVTDNAGNTSDTHTFTLGHTDFIKPKVIYRYSTTDIDYSGNSVKIVFDVTDEYYDSGTIKLSDLTIKIDGEDITNNTAVTKTFPTGTAKTQIVNGSSKTIGHTYTLTLSGLEEVVKNSNKGYLDYSGVVSVTIKAGTVNGSGTLVNGVKDTEGNLNPATTITMGIDLPEESGSQVIADVVNPIWETQNINIDRTNKKVTVDLIGTDKYYASNSLDTGDITVEIDGETTSDIQKALSTVQYIKYDSSTGQYVTATEAEAIGVKYTLTLSNWEQSTLKAGKIFKEWSGTTKITVAADTLVDDSNNKSVAKTFTLGNVDFIKPVIESVSATNGTNKQTIVFNVIDKYLDTTDPVSEGEITVYVDGKVASDITKTIKSKTDLEATVNGATKVIGQQYTVELTGFAQSTKQSGNIFYEWSGTTRIDVAANAVKDTSNNKNDRKTVTGRHVDFLKPRVEEVSSTNGTNVQTIVFNVIDKYLDTTDAVAEDEIVVYVDEEVATGVTKTLTKVDEFKATVNGTERVVGIQYQLVIGNFEQTRTTINRAREFSDWSGTVSIDVNANAVKDTSNNKNDKTTIAGEFADFIKPNITYEYLFADVINYTNKTYTMVFDVTDKYFKESKLTNDTLATYLTIKIDGEDITNNAKVTKQITSVQDVTATIKKTDEGTVKTVTNAVIGKRYTLVLSTLEQNPNDAYNYSGIVTVTVKNNTVTDTSNNGNVGTTTTIQSGVNTPDGSGTGTVVDVVDPIWEQATRPRVKPANQTAEITIKGIDKYFQSSSFDKNDITVVVNGTPTTTGINVTVVEDTTVTLTDGKQYKVTVTGFPKTAYSLKIVIDEGVLVDKSGNTSEEKEFVLYTTLMETVSETEATSKFLGNTYGIERQDIEQIIFMDDIQGTDATRWDVSAVKDKTIMAWYTGSGPYTVYIGSYVIMNANLNSSNLFKYIGYDSSCKTTGDTADNPLIKNLDYLHTDNVTNMTSMFAYAGYSKMKSLDLGDNFNTELVTNMSNMFENCGFEQMQSIDFGQYFYTSNVKYMDNMFANFGNKALTELTLVNNFATSNVTSMSNMFNGCGQNAMTTFSLGENFDTTKVQNMSGMFQNFGNNLETLDLGENFNTSAVTDMSNMFNGCGQTSMKTLTLGNNFNTAKVQKMNGMFQNFAQSSTVMKNLDLGDQFYTTSATNMDNMFNGCGKTAMETLDLGPLFTKIASTYTDFAKDCGKSGAIIYAPEAIYSNMKNFKLNTDSSTTVPYSMGTINSIYRPVWEKVSSSLTDAGVMTVVVKGSANKVGTPIAGINYTSDITHSLDLNKVTVYIDGEEASSITKAVSSATESTNATTGKKEVQYTITLSGFEQATRNSGKNFKEWSGNVSLQLAKGTLVDKCGSSVDGSGNVTKNIAGNKNLAVIDIEVNANGTTKTTDRIEIEDELKTLETTGKMFADDIKPEFTYKYSSGNDINYDGKTLTIIFDVTDKYFASSTVLTNKDNISVKMIDDNDTTVNSKVTKTLTKKTIAEDVVEGNITYKANGDIYYTVNGQAQKIGERYQLVLGNLQQNPNDAFKYSGPISITFPSGIVTDNSGNSNVGTTITVGINEEDGNPQDTTDSNGVIVDVVDPLWTIADIDINATNKNVTASLIANDKYYASNSLTTDKITIYIDGVKVTTTANVKKALNLVGYVKKNADGTYSTATATNATGVKYTLTISDWEETDAVYQASGRTHREYSGTTKIEIAAGTITDKSGNTSIKQDFTLGHVDFTNADIEKISSTKNHSAKTETIVFKVTDKYIDTSDMLTDGEITVYVDGEVASNITKQLTNVPITATRNGSTVTVGHTYTLVLSGFEKDRNAKNYKDWSGTVSIQIPAGAVKDTNTPTANKNDLTTITGDFVDFIKPDIKYTHQSTDINYGTKTYTMNFDITDKYYTSGKFTTTDIQNRKIVVEMQNGQLDANGNPIIYNLAEETAEGVTISLTPTNYTASDVKVTNATTGVVETVSSHLIGHRYTLTISGLEHLERKTGHTTADYSGTVTVKIPVNNIVDRTVTDENGNEINNGNIATTITVGVNIPGGTGTGTVVDVVDPIWEKISSSANAIDPANPTSSTATIKFKGTDTYFDENNLTKDNIKVVVNGSEVSTGITKTLSAATPLEETRLVNGTTSTVQYGVEYTLTITGFAQNAKQVKIRIPKGALVDKSDNDSEVTDFTVYNVLKKVQSAEQAETGAFLGESVATTVYPTGVTSITAIERQNIQKIIFVNSIAGSKESSVKRVWDVSAQDDDSILAWTSQSSAPYTVYIGSDDEIFANQNSSYLFAYIGSAEVCTSETVLNSLSLLNTSGVTNMGSMFRNCGYNAMKTLDLGTKFDTSNVTNMLSMFLNCGYKALTSLDLSAGTTAANTTQFNTSKVTSMRSLFNKCGYKSMTSINLGNNFDTSNVTSMRTMFSGCGSGVVTENADGTKTITGGIQELNLGTKFDTSSVTSMQGMFSSCGYARMTTLNLGSKFDTSSVNEMQSMFASCGYMAMTALNLGGEFDTSSVTNMEKMFYNCGYTAMTTLDLGDKFDTSSVKTIDTVEGTMNQMFSGCGHTAMTKLDLGDKFNTSQVKNMYRMFYNCGSKMTSLDLGNQFYTTAATNMVEMFRGCGSASMTALDLGPAFTKIPSGNISYTNASGTNVTTDAHKDIFKDCGNTGLLIYAPEAIYADINSFK